MPWGSLMWSDVVRAPIADNVVIFILGQMVPCCVHPPVIACVWCEQTDVSEVSVTNRLFTASCILLHLDTVRWNARLCARQQKKQNKM